MTSLGSQWTNPLFALGLGQMERSPCAHMQAGGRPDDRLLFPFFPIWYLLVVLGEALSKY